MIDSNLNNKLNQPRSHRKFLRLMMDFILRKLYFATRIFIEPALTHQENINRQLIEQVQKLNEQLSFLQKGYQTITFPKFEQPEVSIIIPAYNNWDYTYNCLESILSNTKDITYEIIVADDNSTDKTIEIDTYIKGIKVIRNPKNLGFLLNCNNAVDLADGKFILFLNNDTLVNSNSIKTLLDTLKSNTKIGAVGGKIIAPDGTLQEAGNIIWRDGSCTGYGRGDSPLKPEYNYLKEVHYCSGAFLMTPKHLFLELGKFDTLFAPAYYEETDYCMRLIQKKYKIIYQPHAEILHFEFVSHKSEKAFKLLEENMKKFHSKWKKVLNLHPAKTSNGSKILKYRTSSTQKNILYLDDMIPDPKIGSGFPRSYKIISELVDLNFNLTVLPLDKVEVDPYLLKLYQSKGVEVYNSQVDLKKFLNERSHFYYIIFISRPHNFAKHINLLKSICVNAKIIFDTEAVYSLRDQLYCKLNNLPFDENEILKETKLANLADKTICVSEPESKYFQTPYFLRDKFLVSEPHTTFKERSGLLFFGTVLSAHPKNPNYDSLKFFLSEVLPNLKLNTHFTIAGILNAPLPKHLNVNVTGYINDLHPICDSHKVFVVPTRFAAGIPTKLLEASSYGIPSVVTSVIAAQLRWADGQECLIADTAEEFVSKIENLYTDELLWYKISRNCQNAIQKKYSPEIFKKDLLKILT